MIHQSGTHLVLLLKMVVLWSVQERGDGEGVESGGGGAAELDEKGIRIAHLRPRKGIIPCFV